MLADPQYDTPLNIQVPVPASPNAKGSPSLTTVPNPAIPNQWFTCDIRVGSLTLHLDEDNWNKGVVTSEEYDRVARVFDSLAGKVTSTSEEPSQKVSIGGRLMEKVMQYVQAGIKQNDE